MKILWTDGSAEPNPGAGGFAVLEITNNEAKPIILGSDKETTNIRMEGKALIAAIKYAGEEGCEIRTDSEFWINVLEKWAPKWKMNGWQKKNGIIKNIDIVKELWELYHKYPVTIKWVKGHAGIDFNEMADEWANKARQGAKLP